MANESDMIVFTFSMAAVRKYAGQPFHMTTSGDSAARSSVIAEPLGSLIAAVAATLAVVTAAGAASSQAQM